MGVDELEIKANSHEFILKNRMNALKVYKLFKPEYYDWLTNNGYIAGGSIYSIANNKFIRDIDVYFKTKTTSEELRNMLVEDFHWFRHTKENDYTLSVNDIQFIKSWYGEPKDCVSSFDYLHTQYYFEFNNRKIKSANMDFEHLFSNKLILNYKALTTPDTDSNYIRYIISKRRMDKFRRRGMEVDNSTINGFKELDKIHYEKYSKHTEGDLEVVDYSD